MLRNINIISNNAQVLYIDYGNSETVPLSRLRRMKAQFTHCPAMAIKCSIFGVTPRDGQVSDKFNVLMYLCTINVLMHWCTINVLMYVCTINVLM